MAVKNNFQGTRRGVRKGRQNGVFYHSLQVGGVYHIILSIKASNSVRPEASILVGVVTYVESNGPF